MLTAPIIIVVRQLLFIGPAPPLLHGPLNRP